MRIRQTHRFRHMVAVISLLAGFASACVWIINRPEVLNHALAIANAKGSWNVRIDRFEWRPLTGKVKLTGLSAIHKSTGRSIGIDEVDVSYTLLGLLRGKLVIDELALEGVDVVLAPSQGPKKKRERKRIDPARFLIFKHVELVEGRVEGLGISFGKDSRLDADELRLSLVPSIFGAARLAIRSDGVKLDKADRRILTAGFISLKTSTRIESWLSDFPYVNGMSGALRVQDAGVEGLSIDSIKADVDLNDDRLNLEELDIVIGGRRMVGSAVSNIDDQSFELAIDIPEPVALPHIGKDLKTIDTGGDLSGKIRLKGVGFIPSNTSGEGQAELTHRFSAAPDAPVTVALETSWRNGVFTIPGAAVVVGDDAVRASGTIDVRGKSMDIKASGVGFPIEHIFDKFKNPHLAKIFGKSDVEANLTGWGKQFKAHVEGITYDGGWKPIKAHRILTVLDASYDELRLLGSIIQDDKEVGRSDLTVKFGAKMADGNRSKNFDLVASIKDMDLAYPLEELRLSGLGNGNVEIHGPHTSFEGSARATIAEGEFIGLPFHNASTDLSISRKQLEFKDIKLALPKTKVPQFTGSLIGDLSPGRLHLHGEPLQGLTINAAYLYDSKRWKVDSIAWNDPKKPEDTFEVSGGFVSGGSMDMRARGAFDASLISAITPLVRDNSGPMEMDLAFKGSTSDPKIYGDIRFDNTSFTLRSPRVEVDGMSGALRFEGPRITFDDLVASIEDGTATLSGYLDHRGMKPYYADMTLDAKAMRYRTYDGAFNLELDGHLGLKGSFPEPLLSGDINIVDGRYTKDFTIIDAIGSKKKKRKSKSITEKGVEEFNPKLAMSVRSSGDMEIKNNVGEIFLNVNIDVAGTRKRPEVTGSINTSEGFVDYLGLNFDITRGFIEFRGPGEPPYLEVHAEKEVRVYIASLTLYGPIDNLKMDLSATSPHGPLDKHDVVSLLLFGTTDEERTEANRGGEQLGASMAAAGVGGVLAMPITRFAHIDSFSLEAADPESTGISRVSIGKEVSDRLTVKFASDIGVDNAVQTFSAEYMITDNLILEGQRSTDAKYEISGILRFRLR